MALDVRKLAIDGPVLIALKKFGDEREFGSEIYGARSYAAAGITTAFVQDFHTRVGVRGAIRGLHFQGLPKPQAKMLRVIRGRILDVVVDIRKGSPTYGKHAAVELSAENWHQIFVPAEFAHGYCTLEEDTDVLIKTSEYRAPEAAGGLRWNDPALDIAWPDFAGASVSDSDRNLPLLVELNSPFVHSA